MILPDTFHSPVLLPQAINGLKVRKGKKYIDATLGGGGFTKEILDRDGIVLGIDCDKDAVDYVKEKFKNRQNLKVCTANFAHLKKIAEKYKLKQIFGVIFDLGLSDFQLKGSKRGFSYRSNEVLDMRVDPQTNLTAAYIINNYSFDKLYELFTKYSEELCSRAIAQAVLRARSLKGPLNSTGQLVAVVEEVVRKAFPEAYGSAFTKIRNKTLARVFQSLRIAVNDELENLKEGITQAVELLVPAGRIVILSYHSLEDRIVKQKFQMFSKEERVKIITKHPIRADWKKVSRDFKSRSAKLRIAEKL